VRERGLGEDLLDTVVLIIDDDILLNAHLFLKTADYYMQICYIYRKLNPICYEEESCSYSG